jgi:hypothetical protein
MGFGPDAILARDTRENDDDAIVGRRKSNCDDSLQIVPTLLTVAPRRWHRRRPMRSASGEGECMAQITINEGLAWLKTLKKRHDELLALRNDNAHRERRFYGASADKEIVKEPVYDVKVLDRLVTRVAREIRLLEQALKATNARTTVDAYDQDDAVLGELT